MSTLECFQHGKHLIAIVLSAAGEIEIQSHPPLSPTELGQMHRYCSDEGIMERALHNGNLQNASHDRPNQEPF
jgi:hypothetical protein